MKQLIRLLLLAALLALVVGGLGPAAPSASAAAPTLTLTSSSTVYTADQTVRLRSDVSATNLDWVLEVRFAGDEQWRVLCGALNVNDDTFTCSLRSAFNLTARARLIDDKGTESTADDTVEAEVTRSVGVKPVIGTQPVGGYTVSGGVVVLSKGSSPTFRSATYPSFPGKRCLRHQVQRRTASGWRPVVTSACRVQQEKGRVDWRWAGKHPSGVKFRVRATFAGDQVNLAAAGGWVPFRFR